MCDIIALDQWSTWGRVSELLLVEKLFGCVTALTSRVAFQICLVSVLLNTEVEEYASGPTNV